MTMTPTQQIQIAAEIMQQEMAKAGSPVALDVCLRAARFLYELWYKPGGPQRHLEPGEIAQKFRERYEMRNAVALESPLSRCDPFDAPVDFQLSDKDHTL